MYNVNFAYSVSEHPLISEHPLYQSLFNESLDGVNFKKDDYSCDLSFIPTYYKYLNIPHSVIIEDYVTLFFPYIHNGSNYTFDPKVAHFVDYFKTCFESDMFRGILCHMQQTLSSIRSIFNSEKINSKLHYLRLSHPCSRQNIKRTDKSKIVLSFTNSFGGTSNNFPLRGGYEVLLAYKSLYESGRDNIFLNITGDIKVDDDLKSWIENCPNVKIYESDIVRHDRKMISDSVMSSIIEDTDIFLIPACRIHSMSVVNALSNGNIVIGSDGWGFSEFLDESFLCEGQKYCSYIEDNLLKEKYSISLKSPNYQLTSSLINKIESILTLDMDDIKNQNLRESKVMFSKKSKNEEFTKIIDRMIND